MPFKHNSLSDGTRPATFQQALLFISKEYESLVAEKANWEEERRNLLSRIVDLETRLNEIQTLPENNNHRNCNEKSKTNSSGQIMLQSSEDQKKDPGGPETPTKEIKLKPLSSVQPTPVALDNAAFQHNRPSEPPRRDNEPAAGELSSSVAVRQKSVRFSSFKKADGRRDHQKDPLFSSEVSAEQEFNPFRPKTSLRSHLGPVRNVAFHPSKPLLASASEDGTVKFWSTNSIWRQHSPRKVSAEIDPLITFRGHAGPIFSGAFSSRGHYLSGGLDGLVCVWNAPSLEDNESSSSFANDSEHRRKPKIFEAHSDIVWDLQSLSGSDIIASLGADRLIKIWRISEQGHMECINSLPIETEHPTSMCFGGNDRRVIVGTSSGTVLALDIETARITASISVEEGSSTQSISSRRCVHKVVSHPDASIFLSAHEDQMVRYIDLRAGTIAKSIIAHPGPVSALAVGECGSFFLSGGHDGSMRAWNYESGTCLYDLPIHEVRDGESIYSLAYHSDKDMFASAGVEGTVKIYQ